MRKKRRFCVEGGLSLASNIEIRGAGGIQGSGVDYTARATFFSHGTESSRAFLQFYMCAEGTHAPILLLGGRVFLCVVRPQHLVRQVYFTSIRVLDFIFAEEGSGTPLNHHYDAPETGGSTRRSRTLLAEVQRGSPRNHIQAVQKGDTGTKAHSQLKMGA